MRYACPSAISRFRPRLPRPQLRNRALRSTLTAALFAIALLAAPSASNADSTTPAHLAHIIEPQKTPAKRSLSGFRAHVEEGAISLRKSTPTKCLPDELKTVLAEVAARFGEVSVQSTHRSAQRNSRAGGAPRSLHLQCRAIDFRVSRRGREVMAFLRSHHAVGGLKMYRNGLIHIDNGEPRSW
jgi:uncharacterized protein YcbK (DUF882 family)